MAKLFFRKSNRPPNCSRYLPRAFDAIPPLLNTRFAVEARAN
jgi:hypothetical protein